MSDIAAMSFEDAMKALEDLVRQLESGNVELEKSIALYERGAALKAHCEKKLNEAEEKVQKITLAAGQPVGTTPAEGL
ncbi:exodeoxyribonuclease VII small subunit [Defluviimonas sp. WL0075]|uniref:Exodeoxyribonuclease 7 small subunit n=1 Tax=Albidovulum sediminicola TaxID=2984331 RepID=A0ABT2YX31_9RHOB|nr:exodeoxyribonuclease VII small subunit [Defluviimonas sp. WL0075]MCV2863317.1 exodeoxyribonuclease VII small subunit [Defluviimonas sp. WL0075]